uniref:ARID domain-containing protein n=1 Tax=Cynoglossus semilaevis TaxID=244447 RepID=A0A3P8V4H9_CYNSE
EIYAAQRALPSTFSPPGKMAPPAEPRSSGPTLCPSFAEACSFLDRYGAVLDLPEMTFPQMERYLRDTTTGKRSIIAKKQWKAVAKGWCLKPPFSVE